MMTQALMGLISGCRDGGAIFSGESCSGEAEKFSSMMAFFAGEGTFHPEENSGGDRLKRFLSAHGSTDENDPDLSAPMPPPDEDGLDSSGLLGGALHLPSEEVETIETVGVSSSGGPPGDHVLEKVEGKREEAGPRNPVPDKPAGKAEFFQSKRENEGMPKGEVRREEMVPASTRQVDPQQAKGVEGLAREDTAKGFNVPEPKSVERETGLKTGVSESESNSGTPAGGNGKGVGIGGSMKQEPQPAPAASGLKASAGSGPGANAPVVATGNTENTEQHFQGGQEFKDGSEGLRGAERISPEKSAGGSSASNAAKDEDTRTAQTARLVAGAVLKARGGSRSIEIQMKPEVLGRLRIELSITGKQADVRMITEGVAAKEAIEQSMAQIRADLQRQGLDLQRCDVQLGGSFGSGVGPDGRAGGRSPAGQRAEEPRRKQHQANVTAQAGETRTGEGVNRVDYFV